MAKDKPVIGGGNQWAVTSALGTPAPTADPETTRARNARSTPSPANTSVKEGSPAAGAGDGGQDMSVVATEGATTTDADSVEEGANQGVPGGVQVWDVAGRAYGVYIVPGTNPPVPVMFHIERLQQLDDLFDAGQPVKIDAKLTQEEANARGAVVLGALSELTPGLGKNPWDGFLAKVERRARTEPWLKEPDVLAELGAAWLRGDADVDVTATDWYRSKPKAEQDWIKLAASNPTEAESKRLDARTAVRQLFVDEGFTNVSDGLVDLWADKWVEGKISEIGLRSQVRRETDPTADRASPFAGFQLAEDTEFVSNNGRVFARVSGADYELTGPGQMARYLPDPTQAREVGTINRAGELKDLAAATVQERAGQVLLGHETTVRELVSRYIGPYYAGQLGADFVARWAGELRENEKVGKEMLQDYLNTQRGLKFPAWNNVQITASNGAGTHVTYTDIAEMKRPEAVRYYGRKPKETEDWWLEFMQITDPGEERRFLVKKGLERGWANAVEEVHQARRAAFGDNVIRTAGVR